MKIRPLEAEYFHADRKRTNRQTGFILIGVIPMCFHLNILRVSSVKTQVIYCQL